MHKAARIDAAAVSARPHQEEFDARNEHRSGCCREDGIERALHPSHINSRKVVRRFVRTALRQFSHARDPKIVDDGCRVQQHVFGFADPGDHVQPPCGVDVAAVVPNLDQSTLLQFDCTSHERWAPYRRFARACSHHLRKSGTASADPSCPEANTTTVAEMSASENACSFPADASERAFCALNVSVSVERPFAYDFVTASSATAALRSSDEAALNRARFALTSSYAATTSCVACRCSFSTTCSASLLRDRAISVCACRTPKSNRVDSKLIRAATLGTVAVAHVSPTLFAPS